MIQAKPKLDGAIANQDWKIYPNPAGNQLFVESDGGGIVQIFDLVGKKVSEVFHMQDKICIPLGRLSNGLYQVMHNTESRISFKTLSVQK